MTVYVDDAQHPHGRGMIMCHMLADTHEELVAMADRIGVDRRWIQHEGTWREHFDIARGKRKRAIALGAVEITQREMAELRAKRRELVTR